MAYHVPFSQRHTGRPIYIGFDEPLSPARRRRGQFNWSGFTGLMLALVSPFSAFLLAPIALLFSLSGLRRRPRGIAVAGTVFSMLGTAVLATWVYHVAAENIAHHKAQQRAVFMHQQRANIAITQDNLERVTDELKDYRQENNFFLPDGLEGNLMVVRHIDAWETEFRYEPTRTGCIVRSAGPDREFNTGDDLTVKLDGKSDERSLMEL